MWKWMTDRFSKVTIGFMLVGLLFGLLMVATSLIYGSGSEATDDMIRRMYTFELIVCPPSLGLMALDGPEPWYVATFALTGMVLENVLLYWILGVVCNLIWKGITRAPASSKL